LTPISAADPPVVDFFDRPMVGTIIRDFLRAGGGPESRSQGSRSLDMPATTTNGDVKDFEVDPRIKIGLDALTPEDRRTVEEATRSKEDFLARISDPTRVFRLRPGSRYYALKVTSRLRFIYTREGDRINVEDLMNQGLLDRYGAKRARPARGERNPSARGQRQSRREGAV
jgi:hypothetical protein